MHAVKKRDNSSQCPHVRVFNKGQIAEAFAVTLPTVESWLRKGCPIIQRGSKTIPWQFDVFEVYAWKHGSTSAQEGADDPDQMSPKEALDYWRGQAAKADYQEQQGLLIKADDVAKAWEKLIGIAKARLLALPMRLSPDVLQATEMREVEETIKAGITDALEVLSEE